MNNTKPGFKTTEFWITMGYAFVTFGIVLVKPEIMEQWEALIGGGLAIMGYNISRGSAKKGE